MSDFTTAFPLEVNSKFSRFDFDKKVGILFNCFMFIYTA